MGNAYVEKLRLQLKEDKRGEAAHLYVMRETLTEILTAYDDLQEEVEVLLERLEEVRGLAKDGSLDLDWL